MTFVFELKVNLACIHAAEELLGSLPKLLVVVTISQLYQEEADN